MTEFKKGDRLKLVNKSTGAEFKGTFETGGWGEDKFDFRIEGTSMSNVFSSKDWHISKIVPTNAEILGALKVGSLVKFNREGCTWYKRRSNLWVSNGDSETEIPGGEAPYWVVHVLHAN